MSVHGHISRTLQPSLPSDQTDRQTDRQMLLPREIVQLLLSLNGSKAFTLPQENTHNYGIVEGGELLQLLLLQFLLLLFLLSLSQISQAKRSNSFSAVSTVLLSDL